MLGWRSGQRHASVLLVNVHLLGPDSLLVIHTFMSPRLPSLCKRMAASPLLHCAALIAAHVSRIKVQQALAGGTSPGPSLTSGCQK